MIIITPKNEIINNAISIGFILSLIRVYESIAVKIGAVLIIKLTTTKGNIFIP
jgi:hypothetical protein